MFTDNQIFAAPLAGITDKPFRKIMRKFSPDASLVTEMISCHSLVGGHKNCLRNFDDYSDEGAIGAQIFGSVPDLMATAAKILEDAGARWIDINMGCPVPKVATRAGAGAYLMRDHVLAGQIINAVVTAVNIPVSIKTRLGWDEDHKDWTDLIHVAADAGAAFATLHGRTRSQGYTGPARLDQKPNLPIPIIANGDIGVRDDVLKMEQLGYDGVMVGRALLGHPWLFGQLTQNACAASIDIAAVVSEHLDMVLEYYGARTGVPLFRKHAAWYSAGMKDSADFRIKVNQITDEKALKAAIYEFFNCFAGA